MGLSKMNYSWAGYFVNNAPWEQRESKDVLSPINNVESIFCNIPPVGKWSFKDFVRFMLEWGNKFKNKDRVWVGCDICGHVYVADGSDPDKIKSIIRFPSGLPNDEVEMFREYIPAVKWQFAKTYAKTSPHEYTVGKWKPEYQDKMVQIAWFIKKHGQHQMFKGYPYIVYFLDGWKYWTMDDNPDNTTLINRTPVGGY